MWQLANRVLNVLCFREGGGGVSFELALSREGLLNLDGSQTVLHFTANENRRWVDIYPINLTFCDS